MRSRVPRLTFGLLLLILPLWAVLSLDLRQARPAEDLSIGGEGPGAFGTILRAGVARVDLTPTEKMPLGGFAARRGRPFTEVLDHIQGKVLVLDSGAESEVGSAVALVSLEVVLVPPELAEELRERTKREQPWIGEVFVAATHTHAGPGGIWNDRIAGIGGMGRFNRAYTDLLLDRVSAAIDEAFAARVPVTPLLAESEGPAVCRNRDRSGLSDRRMTLVQLRAESGPVARMVVFACHPTFLGHRDRRLSAEWPGEMDRRLDGFTFFLQGAVGDQRPAWIDPGLRRKIDALGESLDVTTPEGRMIGAGALMAQAVAGLEVSLDAARLAEVDSPGGAEFMRSAGSSGHLSWRTTKLVLPLPTGENIAPRGLRNIAGKALSRVAEEEARVSILRLSDLGLVLVPGEVVASLALEWEREVELRTGLGKVRVISLVDGYSGYFETAAAMEKGEGESGNSWYGVEGSTRIGEAVGELASTMVRLD